MGEPLDRRAVKERMRDLLETAEPSAKSVTALYLGLGALLSLIAYFGGDGAQIPALFLAVLTSLLSLVLDAGFVIWCMAVRRGGEAGHALLFDGFSVVGKLIVLALAKSFFIFLWSLLFVVPGIVAMYRYRFALYDLLTDPDLGPMEALEMSKEQTPGYKAQLFLLDLSYLGWALLAALPRIVYQQGIQARIREIVLSTGAGIQSFGDLWRSVEIGPVLGLSPLTWQILILVWGLAVALFYLPEYQCAELEYFDAARSASGIGPAPGDGDAPWWIGGPDDPQDP